VQNRPTRVSGAPAFTALVLGHAHACGLTTSGGILCWGSNAQGQLGDGTFTDRAAPTPVKTDVTFMSLAAGYSFTCGLSTAGDAYCWGTDVDRELVGGGVRSCTVPGYYGELIAVSCSNVPVRIDAPTKLTSLAASVVTSCGVTTDLQALCWGHGLNGPRFAAGSLQFSTIAVGSSDACGLETSGRISCWSLDGSSAQFMTPQPVAAGVAFATLSAQALSYCGVARPAPNVAYCWGSNGYGQLGDGTKQDRNAPVPVVAPLVP